MSNTSNFRQAFREAKRRVSTCRSVDVPNLHQLVHLHLAAAYRP